MAINDPSPDLAAIYNALHSDGGFPAADRVLTRIRANVWDEAYDQGVGDGHDGYSSSNPYT